MLSEEMLVDYWTRQRQQRGTRAQLLAQDTRALEDIGRKKANCLDPTEIAQAVQAALGEAGHELSAARQEHLAQCSDCCLSVKSAVDAVRKQSS
ncbi:MAG TPA: hypothetical protein VJK52_06080 [Candidatus Nanoarchaeia archaeon]|nr:hypothetical protein [Candidatus Nanoarchaeia archaeon]